MGKSQRRKFRSHDKEQLLAEVSNVCPVCGRRLLGEKDGKTICQFEIAHIYPHSATTQQKTALMNINPPQDIESLDNLIALCRECHKKYDSFTTKEDYYKIATLKAECKGRYKATVELSQISIESDIINALKALENIAPDDYCDLSMDPVPIKNKIPKGPLQGKIITLATQYYSFLQKQFKDMDKKKAGKFDIIAQQIKLVGLKAGDTTFIQEDVFDAIVRWMLDKTNVRRTPCEVIVSFFVQNCEVFSAFSK